MNLEIVSGRERSKLITRSIFFSWSFPSHHSRRFVGVVQFLHRLCRCQKHPCTKITVLYFGRTMSGLRGGIRCFAEEFKS
jgi:hypothetical protein